MLNQQKSRLYNVPLKCVSSQGDHFVCLRMLLNVKSKFQNRRNINKIIFIAIFAGETYSYFNNLVLVSVNERIARPHLNMYLKHVKGKFLWSDQGKGHRPTTIGCRALILIHTLGVKA